MGIDKNIKTYVDEFLKLPQGENHNGLLSLANRLVLTDDKYKDKTALTNTLLEVGRTKWGTLDDTYIRDVEATADKALTTAGTGTAKHAIKKTDKLICDYDKARDSWRKAHNERPAIASEIEKSDVSDQRLKSKDAMASIFKNAASDGHVWIAEELSRNSQRTWTSAGELQNRSITFTSEKYFCPCVYGDEVHIIHDKQSHQINQLAGVYERTDSNVKAIVAILMEMDAPMVQAEQITDIKKLDSMAIEELQAIATKQNIALSNPQSKASVMADIRKAYRERIFTDTCLILDALSVKPTTVTFSGGKSYHCLFRLTRPITPEQFENSVERLKSAYKRIGLDDAILTKSRACRFPCGCTQLQAQDGGTQRIMYLDDNADVDFSAIVDAFEKLADEIAPIQDDVMESIIDSVTATAETEQSKATLPVERYEKKDGTFGIREIICDTAFQKDVGIYRIKNKHNENEWALVHKDGNVYQRVGGIEAANLCFKYILQHGDAELADYWKRKMGTAYSNEKSGIYLGDCIELNEPRDTRQCVYAPFQNGLLKISKGGFEMDSRFGGYDIDAKARTMTRAFEYDGTTSEFETFIRHACGECENDAEWPERFEAVRAFIGYMVCRFKEGQNYFCLFTEADNTGNNGGTGKSLICTALGAWRKLCFLDMKRDGADGRFALAAVPDGTEILLFDDLESNFSFKRLFSQTTVGGQKERKGVDPITISMNDWPKLCGGTNGFIKGNDNSHKRRLRFLELSNHYNGRVLAEEEFKHMFPFDFEGKKEHDDSWSVEEWHRFDTFIMKCTQKYLETCKFGGYRSDNLEDKAYTENIPDDVRDWFEDTKRGIFSAANLVLKHFDLHEEMALWYDTAKHRVLLNDKEHSKEKLGEFLKMAAPRFGYEAINKPQRIDGVVKRAWIFEKLED